MKVPLMAQNTGFRTVNFAIVDQSLFNIQKNPNFPKASLTDKRKDIHLKYMLNNLRTSYNFTLGPQENLRQFEGFQGKYAEFSSNEAEATL